VFRYVAGQFAPNVASHPVHGSSKSFGLLLQVVAGAIGTLSLSLHPFSNFAGGILYVTHQHLHRAPIKLYSSEAAIHLRLRLLADARRIRPGGQIRVGSTDLLGVARKHGRKEPMDLAPLRNPGSPDAGCGPKRQAEVGGLPQPTAIRTTATVLALSNESGLQGSVCHVTFVASEVCIRRHF
jgi:hypothetical protein